MHQLTVIIVIEISQSSDCIIYEYCSMFAKVYCLVLSRKFVTYVIQNKTYTVIVQSVCKSIVWKIRIYSTKLLYIVPMTNTIVYYKTIVYLFPTRLVDME